MSSFIVAKKVFDLSASVSPKVLVGKTHLDFSASSDPKVKILKKHFDYMVDVAFDANGGDVSPASKTYTVGKAYGDLPTPTKANCRFDGWWTKPYDSEIEYLQSTGTQWIDTGYIGKTNTKFELDAAPTAKNSGQIGSVYSVNQEKPYFAISFENAVFFLGTQTAGTESYPSFGYSTARRIYSYDASNGQCICGGSSAVGYSLQQNQLVSMYLFARNMGNNTAGLYCNLKIYGFKAYYGNTLVQDLIPVRVGQVGYLYDKVSGQLFGNQGTGSFTLGNDVPEPSASQVTEQSIADLQLTQLYAHWTAIDFSNGTEFDVVTTSSYKKAGIYSATRYSTLSSIYVDWGDGTMDEVDGNISQLAHEYSSVGTFRVRITDNITNFAPSYSNSTWYNTTSQNRYTFKNMAKTGSRCTSMPAYAFYYCSALSSIDFLSSCWTGLTSLPNYAFYYCTGLTQLSSLPSRIKTLGSCCFQYCTGLTGIQDLRNTGLTSLYNSYTFGNCSNVKEWKFPTSLSGTYFGANQFYYNSSLSAIQLPSQLISIPSYCFYYCQQLKSVTIPSEVKSIGNYAFRQCYQLSSVAYETTALTSIGMYAFYNDYNLRDVNVPDTVKSVGNYAFYGCYSSYASALALPSALTSVGTYAYQNCYNLKTLSIPSGLTSIGDYAFAGCHALSSIADYRLTAQTVSQYTFGSAAGTGNTAYTGYNTRGSNVLSVYWAATGYDSGYWMDPLQNNDKCGYSIQYLDPEHVSWCDVTFDARCCGEVDGQRIYQKQYAQGKPISNLPTPTATTEDIQFEGWYTGVDGTGTKYEVGMACPSQDSITLYAHWQVQSGGSLQTYDTHEMLAASSSAVLASEGKDTAIKLEQYT